MAINAENRSPSSHCDQAFVQAWATTLGVLVAVTWPLWTPLRNLPRLAPISSLATIPPGIDFVLLALLASGLLFAKRGLRRIAMATVALTLLLALDQLRWQPWAYHALIAGIVLLCCKAMNAQQPLRWLAASVYLLAAWAKLDLVFATTLGPQFLSVYGIDVASFPESYRVGAGLALPAGELLAGLLLALSILRPALRRTAVIVALTMHAGAIAALGPWGLSHSLGVLLWNVGFAWQTAVLYWPCNQNSSVSPCTEGATTTLSGSAGRKVGYALVVIAALLPAGWELGCWDRWPSWGLYAPRGERAALFIHPKATEQLHASIAEHLEQDELNPHPEAWPRLRLDQWVLAETGAPRYPQNRIAAALAVALAERYALRDRLILIEESQADRWSGERKTYSLDQYDQIVGRARNAHPRWTR